jgi:hypothetical protein
MFSASRYRLLREEKVSKCRCCYPSNERPSERMTEWMDERTLAPAANYPYYSCWLLPKNKRLINKEKKHQLRALTCSTCLPQHSVYFPHKHPLLCISNACRQWNHTAVIQWSVVPCRLVNGSGSDSGREDVELRRRRYVSSERRQLLTTTWYGVTSPTNALFRGRLRSLCGTTSLLGRTTLTSTLTVKMFHVSQPSNTSRGLESLKGFVRRNGQASRCRSIVLINLLLC